MITLIPISGEIFTQACSLVFRIILRHNKKITANHKPINSELLLIHMLFLFFSVCNVNTGVENGLKANAKASMQLGVQTKVKFT